MFTVIELAVIVVAGVGGLGLTISGGRCRSRRRAAVGLTLLVSPVFAAAGICWLVSTRHLDPVPYEPVWLLRRDLAGPPPRADAALAELDARARAGRMSAAEVASVADACLAAQAAPVPWDPAWGQFVETALSTGSLDDARWGTYARQAMGATRALPPTIGPNDAGTLSVNFGLDRCVAPTFAARYDCLDFRVDGRPLPLQVPLSGQGGHAGQIALGSTGFSNSSATPLADDAALHA